MRTNAKIRLTGEPRASLLQGDALACKVTSRPCGEELWRREAVIDGEPVQPFVETECSCESCRLWVTWLVEEGFAACMHGRDSVLHCASCWKLAYGKGSRSGVNVVGGVSVFGGPQGGLLHHVHDIRVRAGRCACSCPCPADPESDYTGTWCNCPCHVGFVDAQRERDESKPLPQRPKTIGPCGECGVDRSVHWTNRHEWRPEVLPGEVGR